MKKLFSLAVAALTALSMNAASIYLMGDGEGLTWDQFPGMKVDESDGYYTVTINNLNSFKISTNEATGWDDGYNAGAYQATGSFGDAVGQTGGQTLGLTNGDANIDTPWAGTYTVKIKSDFTTINLYTQTPKPTNAPDAYLVGGMSSWGINNSYKFSVTASGSNYVYTLDCNIAANTEFKIAGANGNSVNWGGAINYGTGTTIPASSLNGSEININYNGNNMKLGAAFSGTVTLTIPQTAKQNGKISFTPKNVEVTYPTTMFVLGNVNGKGWDPTNGFAMTATSNKGEFTADVPIGNELEAGYGYFSFTESLSNNSSNWDGLGTRYGATANDFVPSYTSANSITAGSNSFKVDADITYRMTLNLVNSTLMISKLETETPDVEVKNFTAVSANVDQTTADINVSYTVENAPADATYTIYYKEANGTEQTVSATATGGTINLTGLTEGTAYTYTVSLGINDEKVDGASATVSFTTTSGTVEPTPDLGDEAEVTFDFTSLENLGTYTEGAGDSNNWTADGSNSRFNVTALGISKDGIKISFVANTATANPIYYYKTSSGGYDLRFYKDNSMTIAAPSGYYMTGIKFATSASNTNINKLALAEGQPGELVNNPTKTMVWTAPSDGQVTSLVFGTGSTTRFDNITISLVKIDGGDEPIDPDPEPEISSVYVVGGGYTWDLPGEEIKGENKVYTFNVTGKFKVSTVNTNDWNEFNAAAYATGDTTFGDEVSSATGQTLPVKIWGEDQELPWDGQYTITLDLNNMTMNAYTATPKPVNAPDVYVRGDMNSWNAEDAWKFTNVSWDATAQTGVFTLQCQIPAGQAFKIADGSWGAINYGGATGIALNTNTEIKYNDQTNLSLKEAFDGTITFTITASKSTATVIFNQESEVEDPENFYIIGTISTTDYTFLPNVGATMVGNGEGLYTAEQVTFGPNSDNWTGFAIVGTLGANDSDWGTANGLRYGPTVNDTKATLGVNTGIGTGDLSWSIDAGTYNLVFDYKAMTLTISEADTDGINSIGTEDAEAVYYNLQGVRVQNPDKGIFIKVVGNKAVKVVK